MMANGGSAILCHGQKFQSILFQCFYIELYIEFDTVGFNSNINLLNTTDNHLDSV